MSEQTKAQVNTRFNAIHAQLSAGVEPQVEAVMLEGGVWRVRWGVDDGGDNLECTPGNARELADIMEADGYFPQIPRLLRIAADMCDARGTPVQ